MRTVPSVLALSLSLLVLGCSTTGPTAGESAARVTALADDYVESFFDAFPYYALTYGAEDRHPDQLVDHGLPALARWEQHEDELLAALGEIDLASLEGRPEAITYKFLQNQLEAAQGFRACRTELWNVSPTWTGWQGDVPLAAGQQPVDTPEQRDAALARFSQLPQYLDDEIANLTEGIRLGYTAPRNNVEVVIEQMDAMLSAPVEESAFVQMAPDDAPDFRTALEELETTGIRPAIQKYRDFLAATYLPAARIEIGVSNNPDGAACYAAAVKFHATVDMAAQQIHDLGLAQMDLIQEQMRAIGERSFGTSDPTRLLSMVKTEPEYRFSSREELIAYAEDAVARGKAAMPQAFGRIPVAPVIVEPYPPFLEKSAPGGQAMAPTPDGKPGKYMINAYNAHEQSKAGLESTAFHETYPGHHMQIAIAIEREGLHPISQLFFLSGFGEGWALYSERLSEEMGLFTSDVDRPGLLSNEALRAARLVVDSGMHALGWSRDQAVEYLLAHTTETAARANAEIDRYIAVPGQATSYMIGNLEIRRLREDAERRLGDQFDLRAFHDLVLEDGAVPLWVLGEKVEQWVVER
jgi:uncharacterized protein (DUF885 family)